MNAVKIKVYLLIGALVLLSIGMISTRSLVHVSASPSGIEFCFESFGSSAISFPCSTPTPAGVNCQNPDNRMDPVCDYPLQTVAVYCSAPAQGDLSLWLVLEGKGVASFNVTAEQLAKVNNVSTRTLITSKFGISLYRLKSGQLQVVGPKGSDSQDFIFTWDGC